MQENRIIRISLCLLAALWIAEKIEAAELPNAQLAKMIQTYKQDPRGPFQGIRWFCPDGSVRPANSPCGQPGGRQHALIRDEVEKLRQDHHLFLGQILVANEFAGFWDADGQNSRPMQYQMEKFLQAVDDGWIMRRARFYRGAFQIEGEEHWGREFLVWLLARDEVVRSQFFLARQLVRDLPHEGEQSRTGQIRSLASTIADRLPTFIDMKNKIHSQPDARDRERIAAFRQGASGSIPADADSLLQQLENEIELAYQAVQLANLAPHLEKLPKDSVVAQGLVELLELELESVRSQHAALAELLLRTRQQMLSAGGSGGQRLALMKLSVALEEALYRISAEWHPQTLSELLEKNFALARAAAGCGFLELWEWQAVEPLLAPPAMKRSLSLPHLAQKADQTCRAVAWGTGMVDAVYEPVVELFAGFEPLARGFIDERVRASVMLPWGEVAGKLADLAARTGGLSNQILTLPSQSQARGQNPGFALGELVVVDRAAEQVEFSDKKIYVLARAPADLKPVAGIATVAEGNAVSHVQLLARNLGIPNAVLSPTLLRELAPFSGTTLFYAVSPRGRVVVRQVDKMTDDERNLFAVRKRREERIAVPLDRLALERVNLPALRNLRATDSGRICGPKAANLGQLGALFPDRVTAGLVIPFGAFRKHMDQPMPGTEGSYWEFLQETFTRATGDRRGGKGEAEVESAVIARLEQLRQAIQSIPFLPWFDASLPQRFREVFGAEMGEVAVFVRSDTNMEDLKDFTGAGLNLTVPNVRDAKALTRAIRAVWASPFTERSYRWRQKYLLNPENVYPSILLQRSVDLDKSGVMITTGIASDDPQDITVAFNRGVGGAVDGQAAESYLLRRDGENLLLSPAREIRFTSLPAVGGVHKAATHLDRPILTPAERLQLRQVAGEIRQRLPQFPGIESPGPFDVELGFKDGQVWLFQARPFVESKQAQSSLYLRSLDPPVRTDAWIPLNFAVEGAGR